MNWIKKTVSAEDVVWCYKNLLHRDPESLDVVADKARLKSFRKLVEEIVGSPEYRERITRDAALAREDVVWCYEKLFQRPPESAKVIEEKLRHRTFKRLVQDIASSDEFRGKQELPDEISGLAFQIVHGRMPEPGESVESYPALGVVRSLRDLLVKTRHLSRSDSVAHLDEPASLRQSGAIDEFGHGKLLVFQTCDHEKYVPLLQESSKTVLEYVRRWHHDYEVFYGIKHGAHPWHATFNRIYRLDELLKSGYRGWVLYLDADAYFTSFDFDVGEWLAEHSNYGLIASRSAESAAVPYWDINAGVFFINLGHPVGRDIVFRWKNYYDVLYSEDDYVRATRWDMVLNDQTSLHGILKFPEYEGFLLTSGTGELFNSGRARVIRQMLRLDHTGNDDENFEKRLMRLSAEVDSILEHARKGRDHG